MDAIDAGADTVAAGETLARARAGDPEAFCRLTEALQNRLLRQAAALSGNVSSAEDLVAETLVEAWKSLARYDESCRFSTWLYAILLHRYQKLIRRARSRPVALACVPSFQRDNALARQANLPSPEPSPAENAAQSEQAALLRQCLARLSKKHQDIIRLRFYEDASLPDMARVLDCPVGTIKSRLHHALEALRKIKMNLTAAKRDTPI